MSLNAEIIAVGTELTNGAKLDTNSQWISRELEDLGHPVGFHTSVADSLKDQVDVLRLAMSRSDLVIMTGGLGPTLDDLARDAIAQAIGQELVLDQPSLAAIEAFFASRNRTMPERNRIQAMFPRGSVPLPNPIGTAPGIWLDCILADGKKCLLASLPGVPSEMKRMFHEQVVPRLPAANQIIRKHVWNCFGLGESDVEQRLGELTARGRSPEVGITAHEATISLRIVARAATEQECQTQIDAASAAIHDALGERVFGSNQIEIEDVLMQQLIHRGWTLATLECGSSAWLAQRVSRAAAESGIAKGLIRGSFCFGTPDAAAVRLSHSDGVSPILSHHLAEKEFWILLADEYRKSAGADLCLAVVYPSLNQSNSPREAAVTIVGRGITIFDQPTMLGSPDIWHSRLAKVAVDILRRQLMKPAQ